MPTPCSRTVVSPVADVMLDLKLPTKPSDADISEFIKTVILSWAVTLSAKPFTCETTSSPVPVCFKSKAKPPSVSVFSTRFTMNPCSARLRAEVRPDTPPPMTRAFWLIGTVIGLSASPKVILAAAIRTRSFAFVVACLGSE